MTGQRMLVDIRHFTLTPGKITLLLGESGIGKTLISRTIFGLMPEKELNITINEQDYSDYLAGAQCREIQSQGFFVFQEPSSHLNPMMTLSDQLNEGTIHDPSSNNDILKALFPALTDHERHQLLNVYPKPYRPSGGEKQRFLIAMAFKKMALLKNPDTIFVFDEPTGNLDNVYRNIFLKMLIEVHKTIPLTVLLITHDYSMITELTTRHSEIPDHIEFHEMCVSDNRQKQVKFSTESYISWLRDLQPAVSQRKSSIDPILRLEPEIEVFGRTLLITNDSTHRSRSSLDIFEGDAVYLKAGSGVGKTTIAKIIMGLQHATRFNLNLKGLDLNEKTPINVWKNRIWARTMSMVFQHADEALNLSGKVKDIFRGLPIPERSDRGFIKSTLETVFEKNLPPSFLDMPVAYLSGGQKQRLNLIRALILEPDILILDEPFNGLDFNTMQRILDLLQAHQKKGKSFLIISHNEEIIDRFVTPDRIYYLYRDRSDQERSESP